MTVVSGILLSVSWRLSLGPRDCWQFLVKQGLQPGHSFHQGFKGSISLLVGLGTFIGKSRPIQEDHSFGYLKIIMINYICKIPSCLTFSVCWSKFQVLPTFKGRKLYLNSWRKGGKVSLSTERHTEQRHCHDHLQTTCHSLPLHCLLCFNLKSCSV